jgi:hypothetical protein
MVPTVGDRLPDSWTIDPGRDADLFEIEEDE